MPPKPRNSKGKEVLKSPGPTTPHVLNRNAQGSPSAPTTIERPGTAPAGVNPFDQAPTQVTHTPHIPHSTPQSTGTQGAGGSTEEPWQQVTSTRKTRASAASSSTQVAPRPDALTPVPNEASTYDSQATTPEAAVSYIRNVEIPDRYHTETRATQRHSTPFSGFGTPYQGNTQPILSPWPLPFRTPLASEHEVISIFSTPRGTYRCSITKARYAEPAVHFEEVEIDYLDPELESVATGTSNDLEATEELQPLAPDSLTLDGRQEQTVEHTRTYERYFDEPSEAARIANIPAPARSQEQEIESSTGWKPRSYQKSTYVWKQDREPPTDNRKKPPPSS